MDELVLKAPLEGWAAPLDEVPDEVFAGRILGDGVVIDPTGSTVHAPCDGQVVSLARTRHAVTLKAANGAEVLIHIGLDTVALNGEGFEAHVTEGQAVRAGDRLISFDLDLLAQRATSLLTPVVVMGEGVDIRARETGRTVTVGEFLLSLSASNGEAMATESGGAPQASRTLRLPLRLGIHARPAALLAREASRFKAETEVLAHGRHANAKSVVALMTLGAGYGAELEVRAFGPDAEAAVEAFVRAIHSHPEAAADFQPPVQTAAPGQPMEAAASPDRIAAVPAAPGLTIGYALRFEPAETRVEEAGRGVAHETEALTGAIARARANLHTGGGEAGAILAAQQAILDDPEILATAHTSISENRSAGFAWRTAVRAGVAQLQALGDPRLAERADDLIDVERQVLRALAGEGAPAPVRLPENAILLADDLLPSDLAGLDTSNLAGLCTARGGPTSHVAIMAASLGIPALVAAGPAVSRIPDGTRLVIDADRGLLHVDPPDALLQEAERRLAARRESLAAARAHSGELCRTADGIRIEVFANLGSEKDAATAAAQGAEGCGLLRTEFLFLDRKEPPSEDEQAAAYQAIADALGGRPIIVRTLDVGGDKEAPYLNLPAEENPALGLRGVRVGLADPELLRIQLRAILRVRPAGQCRIMLPMISSAEEVRTVRAMLEPLARELGHSEPVQLGIMIETPASALLAGQLAEVADFFSVGSNDLTQYALAMDRGHSRLAAQLDALNPAVLRLIALAAEGAARHGHMLGVCGSLASDPAAAPVLLGLGVTELSVTPNMVPEIKALVRRLKLDDCRAMARAALEEESAAAVRARAAALTGGSPAPEIAR